MSFLDARSDRQPDRAVSPWLAFAASPDSLHNCPIRTAATLSNDSIRRTSSVDSDHVISTRYSRSCSLDDNGSVSIIGPSGCTVKECESSRCYSEGEDHELMEHLHQHLFPRESSLPCRDPGLHHRESHIPLSREESSTTNVTFSSPEEYDEEERDGFTETSTGISSEEEEALGVMRSNKPLSYSSPTFNGTQRLEEMSRSQTIPPDPCMDPLRLLAPGISMCKSPDMRRRTLPAMLVTSYSGDSEDDEEVEEDQEEQHQGINKTASLHGSSLRSGFRRRGQRRRKNLSRKSQSAATLPARPTRPNSAGNRSNRPSVVITAEPTENINLLGSNLNKNLSRSMGNLASDDEATELEPPKSPVPKHMLGDMGISPSPRRRSSLLVAISGMLSKSQNNLDDIGEDAENSKVIWF